MKAGEKSLVKYLDGNDQEFVIPVFQRRYDWRIEQCKRLWEDLIRVIESDYTSHFFGSIVSVVTTSPKVTEYLIIDGQQRITSVSLLMAALCNLVSQGKLSDEKGLAEKIYNEYLIDPYVEGEDKFRLKLILQDRAVFNHIVDRDFDEMPEESNVWINYDFYVEQILKNMGKYSIDKIFGAIRSLFIVDIQLTQGSDDPQLIFESLNSTGLALSEGDKIRNLVLMNQPVKKQTEYYAKYWQKIEANTNVDKSTVSDFIRDYLTTKLRRIPRADRVYFEFKDYYQSGTVEIEPLLSDLLKFSKHYHTILTAKSSNQGIQNALELLLKLDNHVTIPYLLELFEDYENCIFDADCLINVLRFLESFLFRRTICSVQTNALNKYFASLEKEIMRYPVWKTQYYDVLIYVASKRQSSSRFPSDDEFRQALITRDLYNMQARNKVYLFEELENSDNEKIVDLLTLLKEGTLTIEHIMPQTLSKEWEKALGTDFQTTHVEYLHTLGNLTLTAYNSKYSNHTFVEKKSMNNGFQESKLTLNKYVQSCDQWGKSQIEERAQILAALASKRWPVNISAYQPVGPTPFSYSLQDDMSFSFLALERYEFQGTETIVHKWSEMYKQLFQKLFEQDPSVLSGFAKSTEKMSSTLSVCVASDSSSLRTAFEISHNIFVELNLSTDRKIQVLRELFELYGTDQTDLSFTVSGIKGSKKTSDEDGDFVIGGDVSSPTKEKQLVFWTAFNDYAFSKPEFLMIFHQKKPQPQQWYDLAAGNAKYHIGLTINTQKNILGAELYIDNDKELFHHFESQKSQIEAFLDTSVEWIEAKKASRILASREGEIDSDQSQIEKYFDWYCNMAIKIRKMAEKFENEQIELTAKS